jgi:O-antigen ligase
LAIKIRLVAFLFASAAVPARIARRFDEVNLPMSNPTYDNIGSPWGGVVGLWFLFTLGSGGVTNSSFEIATAQFCLSSALLLAALWRLRQHGLNWFVTMGWCILLVGTLHVAAQLILLPASIWTGLPGRELIKNTLALTGPELPMLPLSLMPSQTASVLLSLITALTGLVSILSFKSRDMFLLALAIVFGAIVSSGIGLFQKSGQAPDWLYFHSEPGNRFASGFFRNRNFLAALMFSSLPFLAVVAIAAQRQFRTKPIIIVIFILTYMAIMLAGLSAVGSRGGILLAMPAVLLTIIYVYKIPVDTTRVGRSGLVALSVLGAIFVMTQASMLGILRLAKTDPMDDYRATILDVTWTATKAFWPVGSGFGTFVNVYQIYETPSAIVDRYVNAAHNDWLQLILEGGLISLILCSMFIALFVIGFIRTMKFNLAADEYSAGVRAGVLTVFLLSLHALVDFGLRTPALLSLFSMACGLVCLSGRYEVGRMKAQVRSKKIVKVIKRIDPLPQDRELKKQYFKAPSVEQES